MVITLCVYAGLCSLSFRFFSLFLGDHLLTQCLHLGPLVPPLVSGL